MMRVKGLVTQFIFHELEVNVVPPPIFVCQNRGVGQICGRLAFGVTKKVEGVHVIQIARNFLENIQCSVRIRLFCEFFSQVTHFLHQTRVILEMEL